MEYKYGIWKLKSLKIKSLTYNLLEDVAKIRCFLSKHFKKFVGRFSYVGDGSHLEIKLLLNKTP